MRILSGIQPSGKLHLGNYLGALRQFVDLQGRGEALFFIADLHALTSLRDGQTLDAFGRDVALDYLACGLDPQRAVIWRQSAVSQHAELAWILGCVAPMALLERAHSYKDKVARGVAAEVGLFTYPILMAADILLYGATHVPVGQDQKQHLEIARDLSTKFNVAFVPGFDPAQAERPEAAAILRPPAPLILEQAAVVPGVDGQKMSKSYGNTLELFGDEAALKKRIMGIVTDSTPVADPKPEPAALLTLLRLLAGAEEGEALAASWRAGGVGYGTYKKRLVELVFDLMAPARRRRTALARDPGAVEAVLAAGAVRARALAAPQWNRVVRACGCGTPLPEP